MIVSSGVFPGIAPNKAEAAAACVAQSRQDQRRLAVQCHEEALSVGKESLDQLPASKGHPETPTHPSSTHSCPSATLCASSSLRTTLPTSSPSADAAAAFPPNPANPPVATDADPENPPAPAPSIDAGVAMVERRTCDMYARLRAPAGANPLEPKVTAGPGSANSPPPSCEVARAGAWNGGATRMQPQTGCAGPCASACAGAADDGVEQMR